MAHYVGHRLLQFIPTFLGITVVTIVLLQITPGDPIMLQGDGAIGDSFGRASLEAWRQLKGLDRPLPVQYLHWLWSLITFDFGRSLIDERSVATLLYESAPLTLLLNGIAIIAIYGAAIPLGVYSAVRRGSTGDRVISTSLFVMYSMPAFCIALLLIVFLGGGTFLDLFPVRGLHSDGMQEAGFFANAIDVGWHLVLPVFCLAYPGLARTSRFQRSAMLDVVRQDYIRTARAKGLSERAVIVRHALKNSLLPIVTLLSLDLPWLVGGSLIVERIFTIRGMGMLMFEAILRRDYPVIMGVVTLVAIATMVAVLLGDLALAWLDPRIRLREVER